MKDEDIQDGVKVFALMCCIQKLLTLNLIQVATASPWVVEKTCLWLSQRSSDLDFVSSNSYKSGLVQTQKYQLLLAKMTTVKCHTC